MNGQLKPMTFESNVFDMRKAKNVKKKERKGKEKSTFEETVLQGKENLINPT